MLPDSMFTNGLPNDVQLFLCEWDMLLQEGQIFARRLERLGKNVKSTLILEVVHGWDKHPEPWRDQKAIDTLYEKACAGLRESFGDEDVEEEGGKDE